MKKIIIILAVIVALVCALVIQKKSIDNSISYKAKEGSSRIFKINPMVIVNQIKHR